MRRRLGAILTELRAHAPFTLFGAITGVLAMFLFAKASPEVSHRLFQVFHPAHVVLSAIVTASLFRLHEKKQGFLTVLLIGYVGAVGVATLSDSILPFWGESFLGVAVPTHASLHEAEGGSGAETGQVAEHDHAEHDGKPHIYLGFIEDWYLVNPAALLGIFIAWFWPRTKFPHAGHILISTWASSFHVLMNTHRELTPMLFLGSLRRPVRRGVAALLRERHRLSDAVRPLVSPACGAPPRSGGGPLMTDPLDDKARHILREAGLYCTEARVAILKVLLEATSPLRQDQIGGHLVEPDAEQSHGVPDPGVAGRGRAGPSSLHAEPRLAFRAGRPLHGKTVSSPLYLHQLRRDDLPDGDLAAHGHDPSQGVHHQSPAGAAGGSVPRLRSSGHDGTVPDGQFFSSHAKVGRLCRWNPQDTRGADSPDLWFEVQLLDVRGPADANFAVWQADGVHAPMVFMSTHNGGITAEDVFYISAGSHVHANWGFTQPGLYAVDFRVSTVLRCDDWLTADSAPPGDGIYYGDGRVDFHDFAWMAAYWRQTPLEDDPNTFMFVDPNDPAKRIGPKELTALADQWLLCGYPGCGDTDSRDPNDN